MHEYLKASTRLLQNYLTDELSALDDDWWQALVFECLSVHQQKVARQNDFDSLYDLDLAALLRVFDNNWYQVSQNSALPRETRNWIKELQLVRNKWAHLADDIPPEEEYRDMDTLIRLLQALKVPGDEMAKMVSYRLELMSSIVQPEVPPPLEPVPKIEVELTSYDRVAPESITKPTVTFIPGPEEVFKARLIEQGYAWRSIIKLDGSITTSRWNASRITKKSSISANIWSGVLRNWKSKQIKQLILHIDANEDTDTRISTNQKTYPASTTRSETRARATRWLKENYPELSMCRFYSSKFHSLNNWWFFTLPETYISNPPSSDVLFLLEKKDDKQSFHLIKIPGNFFASQKDRIEVREQNDHTAFDLHISADKSTWLKTDTTTYLDFSNHLL